MKDAVDNGFAIFEDVLHPDECDALLSAISDKSKSRKPGSRNLISKDNVRDLADDERLIAIARMFLGVSAVAYKAILFDKSPDTNWLVPWHQDRVLPMKKRFSDPGWGPWTSKDGVNFAHAPTWAMDRVVALRLHLDESTAKNGPLRVIPGSHKLGVLQQKELVDRANGALDVTCTVGKGGIVAMRPLLIHASSKSVSDPPRRVLHIEYADTLQLTDKIELALC